MSVASPVVKSKGVALGTRIPCPRVAHAFSCGRSDPPNRPGSALKELRERIYRSNILSLSVKEVVDAYVDRVPVERVRPAARVGSVASDRS